LVTTVPAHAGNRWAYKKLPYDTLADFIPVTVLPQQPLILVAHPSVAANNVADLIKLAKQRPGKINYASFGVGGLSHLAGVQLNLLAGTQMNHVPYKGGGPALADLMGGHVDLYFSGLATTLPLIADGKIKPIAVASATRVRSLPNVPAVRNAQKLLHMFRELGYPESRLHPVLNRVDRRSEIGLPEVRKALGLEQQWRSIPDAAQEVQATINAGVPLAESSRNSAVVRELGAWADALAPQAREDSNGFLNRIFRRA
jgi:hypothetical protein